MDIHQKSVFRVAVFGHPGEHQKQISRWFFNEPVAVAHKKLKL
jgi:hypothetical protein